MIPAALSNTLLAMVQGEHAEPAVHAATEAAHAVAGVGPSWALLIPGLPILGVILATLCAIFKVKSKLPAWLTVGSLAGSFFVTLALYNWFDPANGAVTVHAWDWFAIGEFRASFGLYIDTLTIFWMLFVTGLATLIGLYASEYMSPDVGQGYNRFFFAFNLFVFSMACLVMGSGLAMLYLGWEGVGLCSYLLIGYYYKKDSAVQAAKKAFIVNRIGDLGLALGLYLTFVHFGTIEYAELFSSDKLLMYTDLAMAGNYSAIPAQAQWIPLLLMVGAFGKSAQFPLYVWLPDAMEGPTPVSALIHAATMVTAGVYLVARFYPVFLVSEHALPIVAWIGTITALLAATIGMAQFDIKRIMAYSTVSQLGYMFAGLGVLSPTGAGYHVLTHAFFKALLFLACGAVMHGFAGQLDLRKLSGLRRVKGWGIVTFGMFVGCINLAGVPFTAGYFSKDTILAEAFVTPGTSAIGWILLFTAGLTAYYTFRVFFRVFCGPVHFEPGDEVHDHEDHADGEEHAHDAGEHGDDHHDEFHPHAPGWAVNTVLATLAVCSLLASGLYIVGGKDIDVHGHTITTKHYAQTMMMQSTASFTTPYDHHGFEAAAAAADDGHAAEGEAVHAAVTGPYGELTAPLTVLGTNPHKSMYYISAAFGAVGIFIAYLLHLRGRTTASECKMDAIAKNFGPIPRWAEHKWYVDEFYDKLFRGPLHIISNHFFRPIDRWVIDGLVNAIGWLPRIGAGLIRPSQSGELHGYASGMVVGLTVLLFLVLTIVLSMGAWGGVL